MKPQIDSAIVTLEKSLREINGLIMTLKEARGNSAGIVAHLVYEQRSITLLYEMLSQLTIELTSMSKIAADQDAVIEQLKEMKADSTTAAHLSKLKNQISVLKNFTEQSSKTIDGIPGLISYFEKELFSLTKTIREQELTLDSLRASQEPLQKQNEALANLKPVAADFDKICTKTIVLPSEH